MSDTCYTCKKRNSAECPFFPLGIEMAKCADFAPGEEAVSEKHKPTHDMHRCAEELANKNNLDVLRHAVYLLEAWTGKRDGWCDCQDPSGLGAYICPDCGLYYHRNDCP